MNKILAAAVTAAILAPAGVAVAAPMNKEMMKDATANVSGLVQIDYRRGKAPTATGGEHEFNVRRARLNVSGKVNDMLSYGTEISGDNSAAVTFLDAYGMLNVSPMLGVTIGQFKPQFDIEGLEGDNINPFMDRSMVTKAVAGGVSSNFRDKGVQLSGGMSEGMAWGYGVGLFQGEGTTGTDASATGNSKFMFTLNGWLAPMAGSKVNIGYANNDQTPRGTTTTDKSSAMTIGYAYEANPIMARFEYYTMSNDDGTGDKTKTSGFYLMGAYTVMPDLDLMLRYQTMKDENGIISTATSDNQAKSIDLGAKWYLERQGSRGGSYLALNYSVRDADANVMGIDMLGESKTAAITQDGDKVDNVIALRLQVQFP